MSDTDRTIARFRRDLALASGLKALLAAAAVACLVLRPFLRDSAVDPGVILAAVGGVWLILSYQSLKGSRLAAGAAMLIARGELEQAESQIQAGLRAFSMFRAAKLLSLQHLALLRHTQRRWAEAAALCGALLSQRLGPFHHLAKPMGLVLADSLLELGDVRGAEAAIAGVYRHRLSLGEAMRLLLLQLDHGHRTGAWGPMLEGVATKVQLAELMPADAAARAQAFLGLAAHKTRRTDLCQWLKRRVELLTDVQSLVADRPLLGELWAAS